MISILGFLTKNPNKRMTLKAWVYAAWYRFLIRFFSQKRLERTWGILGEESSTNQKPWQNSYCILVARNVNRVAGNTPWESKCLVRALTARKLLMKKNIPCTLYLGVGKDEDGKMIAHAWLRAGKIFVTGGNGENYAMVAKFRT